jgi:hypothetical protein
MKWHLTESRPELDNTDELPVLSEESVLDFKLIETAPAEPQADPLEASVEALREALDLAERRWATLESRLATQDEAIADLRKSVSDHAVTPVSAEPVPEIVPQAQLQAASIPVLESIIPEPAGVDPASLSETVGGDADRSLLEQIASLEAYIAGRADRWHEMEQQVDAKSRRIAELEAELEQRIDREEQLQERLHDEGERSSQLKSKLRRMSRRLEEAELESIDVDLDSTREMVGWAIRGALVRFHHDGETPVTDSGRAPKILCLSADLPEPFIMSKDSITIGRAPDCDIEIATDFVSRRHATIRRDNSATIIEDRASTNGVFVNAERVARKALADGDEITIGESRFRFVAGEPLS